VLAVRPALQYPNVTLLRNSQALRLLTNASGRSVKEVIVERDGEEQSFVGDIVVLSCGAANSAKLLLMSANGKHPNGLANGSDMVGRHYMYHNSTAVLAVSREPNLTFFQKTIALNDFYFGTHGFEFPMGNIQMVGKSVGEMYKGEKPLETKLAPLGLLNDIARHAVDFWLGTEDLPDPNNRVSVDRNGKITLSYTPNNQVPQHRLYEQLKSMLGHLGLHPDHLIPRNAYLKTDIPIAGVAHQAGTCRFGVDPKTSVLDVHCKAHELDNLYVVDTSFFVSIGAVNPALTAMANAIRVAEHLAERLHSKVGSVADALAI
jgi:choline dehydrogenase-like flavoprotein